MRPYMLWLARMYGGRVHQDEWVTHPASGLLGDWIKYQSEQRFLVEAQRA